MCVSITKSPLCICTHKYMHIINPDLYESFLYGQMLLLIQFDWVSIIEMSYHTTTRVGYINSTVARRLTLLKHLENRKYNEKR